MKYPAFPPDMRNSRIFEGLIEDIVSTEDGLNHDTMEPRSLAIASLCIQLVAGERPFAEVNPYKITKRDLRGTNSMISAIWNMILSVDNPAQATSHQRNLHSQVVRSLRNGIDIFSRQEAGYLPERVALGLLTRYAHPDMLAFPSLPHHEQGSEVSGHYDIGVIIKNPDDTIDAHHLQVKSDCFDSDGHPIPSKHFPKYQQKYRPFIQLVSGCCHLDMRGGRSGKVALAELLIKEAGDVATRGEIKYLDDLTDNLIFRMTTGQLPRGEAAMNGLVFSGAYLDSL